MFWPTQYYLPIAKLFSNTGNLEMYHRYCTGNYLSRPLTKTFTAAAFTNAKLEISSMFKSSQLHPHPRQIRSTSMRQSNEIDLNAWHKMIYIKYLYTLLHKFSQRYYLHRVFLIKRTTVLLFHHVYVYYWESI